MLPFNNLTKIVIINFSQRFHLYIHAYALLLLSRGLSLFQISAIESIVIGTIFVMEVPTGVIADRMGHKWSIAASTFFMMSAEALFLFARSYSLYILIAIITGTGFAFASGAIEAMVYESLPEKDREQEMKRAMGLVNSMGQIAFFIAPIIGAIIIGDATSERFMLAIVLTIVALFVGLLVSFTLKPTGVDQERDQSNVFRIFREGIAELQGSPQLRRIVMLVVFTAPFTGTLIVTLAAPYLTLNGNSPFAVGVALSAGSLLGALTQRYAYKIEQVMGQRNAVTLLILLPGVMYMVLAVVAGPLLTMMVVIFMYGTNDMKAPLFSAYQNALIGSRNRATILSIINMFVNLFVAVAAPFYAAIAMNSLPAAFVIMGSVILSAGLLLRVHRLPVQQTE